jgi:DNA gyrase/topoisomerase IV subunit B
MDEASGRGIYKLKGSMVNGFVDATSSDRWKCNLFLCEGISAAGSLRSGRRDTLFNAVLPLRGKVKNVKDSTADQAMDNQELFTIFRMIGLGIDVNNVTKDATSPEEAYSLIQKYSRYGKIIIATDADEDGYAIRNGLCYAFSKFARFIIDFGLLYVIESPIFEQGGTYFYPSDPLIEPGQPFRVGMNPAKHYRRFKGLGQLNASDVYDVFYDESKRRLFRIVPDGMDYAMKLVEDINARKQLLINKGILTNPYNFMDL